MGKYAWTLDYVQESLLIFLGGTVVFLFFKNSTSVEADWNMYR